MISYKIVVIITGNTLLRLRIMFLSYQDFVKITLHFINRKYKFQYYMIIQISLDSMFVCFSGIKARSDEL